MKKIMNFLKSSWLIVIGFAIGAGILYVAAGLAIPTNIDNAVQVIKRIYVSSDGVSTTGTSVLVTLDSANTETPFKVIGNAQIGKWDNTLVTWSTYSTIAWWWTNTLSWNQSIVAWWKSNTLIWDQSNVGWWISNRIQGNNSSVVWWELNVITWKWSIIAGGQSNSVSGDHSFAVGYNVKALHDHVFIWSDDHSSYSSAFSSTTWNMFLIRAKNGVGINTWWTASWGLDMTVRGEVGAKAYCNENGLDCFVASDVGAWGGDSHWSGNGNHIYNTNTANVGIGVSDPSQKLQVSGSIDITTWANYLRVRGKAAVGYYTGYTWFRIGTVGAENIIFYAWWNLTTPRMFINSADGRVGIGTDTPSAKFNVYGNTQIDAGSLTISNLQNKPILGTDANGTLEASTAAEVYNVISGYNYRRLSGSNIYNTNTANVGIGMKNPAVALDVSGSAKLWWDSDANWLHSVAMGKWTLAAWENAVAMGKQTQANWLDSVAMWSLSQANWTDSLAMGSYTEANGRYSVAMWYGSKSNGERSFAMWDNAIANSHVSIAMWKDVISSGWYSVAMGFGSWATWDGSTALWVDTRARAYASTSMWNYTRADGMHSTSMWFNTSAKWTGSVAMWESTRASGENSVSMWEQTEVHWKNSVTMWLNLLGQWDNSLMIWKWNISRTDSLFEIWNGTSTSSKSNAMTVLTNGNVGIGTDNPTSKLEVNGNVEIADKLMVNVDDTAKTVQIQLNNRFWVEPNEHALLAGNSYYGSNWTRVIAGGAQWIWYKNNWDIQFRVASTWAADGSAISFADPLTIENDGDSNFDSNTLFVDASANSVGIGTSSPWAKLEINNIMKLTPTDAPTSCATIWKWWVYFDNSLSEPCYCDWANRKQFDGWGNC